MTTLLRGLWSYRFFVIVSVWNEFYLKFSRSTLGGAWLIFHPLSQVMIYAFILSNLLAAKLPGIDNQYAYAIYLMAGLLGWNLFYEILTGCMKVFVMNANSLKKVNFPKITLPLIVIGTSILNNILLFIVMIFIFLLLGHIPNPSLVTIIPISIVVVLLAASSGIILGIVNVFIRDIEQIIPILLQILFWLTPIVYPSTIIPETYLWYLSFNPLFHIVEFYHQIILYDTVPSFLVPLLLFIFGLLLSYLAIRLFRRASPEMVDVL